MTDQPTSTAGEAHDIGARQRAIEAYEGARDRASDTLSQAPLIALAGGLAAGALIAALLPRTDAETRLVRPTARRVKKTASAALDAARGTGSQRLDEMGLNRQKGEDTIRKLLDDLTDAAKASADAALEAARNANES
jgi:glutamine synthetase adenylyltransferase